MGGTHSPPLEITYNRSQLRNHWMFIFLAQCPGVKTILMVSCPRFPSSPLKAFIFNRYHPVPSSTIQSLSPRPAIPKASPRHPCGIPSKAPVQSGDGLCHFFRRAVSRCAGASTLALAEEDGPGKSSKNQRVLGRCWKMNWIQLDDFFLDIVPFKITEIRHRAATRSHGSDLSLIGCFRSRCKQLIPENLAKSS